MYKEEITIKILGTLYLVPGTKVQVMRNTLLAIFLTIAFTSVAQLPSIHIAKLKYNGGGDWYANKTSLPNLIKFCNQNLKTNIAAEEDVVEVGSPELFNYPFIHMTGHGNVTFTPDE